jgi:shikimate kinase
MDTDRDIENREGRNLWEIIQAEGMDAFLWKEEAHILSIQTENSVISTGGSAVYGERAMAHLKRLGVVIYLRADMAILSGRIEDPDKRGVVRKPGQDLRSLFEERDALYLRYADRVVTCPAGESPEATADRVRNVIN